jgi:serine/threonine protein kinase
MNLVTTLHNSGFIHGDIRPSNVLKARDGSMKLIDLETVERHKCLALKRKGSLVQKALGPLCDHLIQVAKYLQVQ